MALLCSTTLKAYVRVRRSRRRPSVMASEACLRFSRSASRIRERAMASGTSWPSMGAVMAAQSSSKSRVQLPTPTGLISVSSVSSTCDSWWGRSLRSCSTVCSYTAAWGSA